MNVMLASMSEQGGDRPNNGSGARVAAAAQSLEEQATRLKDVVSVFRIADTGLSTPHMATAPDKPRLPAAGIPARHRAGSVRPTVAPATTADKAAVTTASAATVDWGPF